jgi:hypothetical protein
MGQEPAELQPEFFGSGRTYNPFCAYSENFSCLLSPWLPKFQMTNRIDLARTRYVIISNSRQLSSQGVSLPDWGLDEGW